MSDPKLRINVNTNVFPKVAGLVSNSVILGANAYLIACNITQQVRDRKQQRVSQRLELGTQMASAVAGITKIIIEVAHHGKNDHYL